jgi:uncharacterized protein (DUF433 family)
MTDRMTIEPGKRSGQPCLRGLRITVWDVLSWLAAGMTEHEILDDYPELESADFRAVYEFAVRMGRRVAHVVDQGFSHRPDRLFVPYKMIGASTTGAIGLPKIGKPVTSFLAPV